MAKPVTAQDVARRAQVASGTVSRVLNNHNNVSPELRARVLAAAHELGYDAIDRPRGAPLEEIGFLLSLNYLGEGRDPMESFWANILRGAEAEAAVHNVRVTYRSLAANKKDPDAIAGELHRMGFGAGMLVGTPDQALIDAFKQARLPAVLVDYAQAGGPLDAVQSDNFDGARMAVEHLIAAGHRRIAFVGGPPAEDNPAMQAIYTIEWRAIGYRTALYRAGIAPDPELQENCRLGSEEGYKATRRLLERTREFTAVFCANDLTACGVLRALHESGIEVPERVSVIGFDDHVDAVAYAYPPLSTIRVDTEAMGAAGVRALMERIDHPSAPPTTVVLPVQLVPRKSVTGPPPPLNPPSPHPV